MAAEKVTVADYAEYGGIEIDGELLVRLLTRATRDIEALTYFTINWDTLADPSLTAVKNAVCAQVEFLAINGETASSVGDAGGASFSIGSYSEGASGSKATNRSTRGRYADSVIQYLWPTGLLYAGVVMRYGC